MSVICVGARGIGKTVTLIRASASSGRPIAVASQIMIEEVKRKAMSMGLDIPEPVLYSEVIKAYQRRSPESYLVDDVQQFLDRMHVDIATVNRTSVYMLDDENSELTSSIYDIYVRRLAIHDYANSDARATKKIHGYMKKQEKQIVNVIFNNPATIVFWADGTKTVVKAENEPFDPEKGLAMAIAKYYLGNKHDYYNVFKKWLRKGTKK